MTNSSPGCWRGAASRPRRSSAISIRRFGDLMPDPFVMRDMEAATARLRRAVERGERVAIFGDYDVDGACSAALLSEYLAACGLRDDRPYPRPRHRRLRPQRRGDRGFRRQGRDARRDRRLRRGQPRAVRGCRAPRPRRHRVRPSPGAGDAAESGRGRRSEPAGRSLGSRLSLARRASSSWRWSR